MRRLTFSIFFFYTCRDVQHFVFGHFNAQAPRGGKTQHKLSTRDFVRDFFGGAWVQRAPKKILPKIVRSVRQGEVVMFTNFHVPHSNCICVVSSHWGRLLLWVRAPFLASRVESSR